MKQPTSIGASRRGGLRKPWGRIEGPALSLTSFLSAVSASSSLSFASLICAGGAERVQRCAVSGCVVQNQLVMPSAAGCRWGRPDAPGRSALRPRSPSQPRRPPHARPRCPMRLPQSTACLAPLRLSGGHAAATNVIDLRDWRP